MSGLWSRLRSVLLDEFDVVVVYLDDIVIFSKTNEKHTKRLCEVIKFIRQEKLYAHQNKCFFRKDIIELLGHTVSKNCLIVDKRKTSAIDTMAPPTTRKELLSFLGLIGHYRRFYATLSI